MSLDDEALSQNPHPDYAESIYANLKYGQRIEGFAEPIPASRPHAFPEVTRWSEPAEHEHCRGYELGHPCCGCHEVKDASGTLSDEEA